MLPFSALGQLLGRTLLSRLSDSDGMGTQKVACYGWEHNIKTWSLHEFSVDLQCSRSGCRYLPSSSLFDEILMSNKDAIEQTRTVSMTNKDKNYSHYMICHVPQLEQKTFARSQRNTLLLSINPPYIVPFPCYLKTHIIIHAYTHPKPPNNN